MGEFSISHIIILVIILAIAAIPLIAIIDVAKSSNKNKALWIVFIFFTSVIGASLYWLFGRKHDAK